MGLSQTSAANRLCGCQPAAHQLPASVSLSVAWNEPHLLSRDDDILCGGQPTLCNSGRIGKGLLGLHPHKHTHTRGGGDELDRRTLRWEGIWGSWETRSELASVSASLWVLGWVSSLPQASVSLCCVPGHPKRRQHWFILSKVVWVGWRELPARFSGLTLAALLSVEVSQAIRSSLARRAVGLTAGLGASALLHWALFLQQAAPDHFTVSWGSSRRG